MKIYMLCDMEGVSGLYTREHTWYWEAGAQETVANEGCRLMTERCRDRLPRKLQVDCIMERFGELQEKPLPVVPLCRAKLSGSVVRGMENYYEC